MELSSMDNCILPLYQKISQWDDIDIYYLANTFNVDQLKVEIASTKRKFPYEDWHTDFIEACQEAIRWIRASQPKPTPKLGSKFIDVNYLKQKIDIVATINNYTELTKCGQKFRGMCPFHSERKPSFFVYPDSQSFNCFGCNTGGDVIYFLQKIERVDFKQALAILVGTK